MPIGITQMSSMLSSQHALQNISNLNATTVALNGQSRVLTSEIEQDKGRGVDTSKKEASLTKMQEGIHSTEENMGNGIAGLNEQIASDREKIREEGTEEASQVKKVNENPAESGSIVKADAYNGITESVEIEISPEGKEAAAAHAEHISHSSAETSPVTVQTPNKIIDKKA